MVRCNRLVLHRTKTGIVVYDTVAALEWRYATISTEGPYGAMAGFLLDALSLGLLRPAEANVYASIAPGTTVPLRPARYLIHARPPEHMSVSGLPLQRKSLGQQASAPRSSLRMMWAFSTRGTGMCCEIKWIKQCNTSTTCTDKRRLIPVQSYASAMCGPDMAQADPNPRPTQGSPRRISS
eukprot:3423497-Rhodomonas_salina.1